jgi:hypothetical protein
MKLKAELQQLPKEEAVKTENISHDENSNSKTNTLGNEILNIELNPVMIPFQTHQV